MGFSRQENWSRLPFPPPGDLPNPGIEPMSPVSPALAGRFFTTEPPPKTGLYPIPSLSEEVNHIITQHMVHTLMFSTVLKMVNRTEFPFTHPGLNVHSLHFYLMFPWSFPNLEHSHLCSS